ncbi:cell division protein FtsQ/DivIB [Pseudolactococcus piscium]|uniref:cell division protein FtsQ/DivIB n=1 Tax=Pseudolactococcus piscium TaxID=1364 RepID=UPI0015CAD606|nr:cell division protein FtsQ/DivIB [Lactococcus piscium]
MADKDKDKQAELTPWQKQHAAFEKKKAAEAAKQAREERRQKQPIKVVSVVEKYDAIAVTTPDKPPKQSLLAKFKAGLKPNESKPMLDVLGKMWPFLLVFILILLGSGYVVSPLSKIGSFKTTGNVHESTKQIAAATSIKTGDHVWKIVKAKQTISSQITKAFPRVKSASISLQLPNHFTAKITEYGESIYLKTGATYQIALSDGTLLTSEAVDPQKLNAMPVLEGFNQKEVEQFVKAYETLTSDTKAQMTTVTKVPTKATTDFIAIDMKDGNQVRVPLSQMADKLPYYKTVAQSITEASVVDMEAGIYAKPKAAYQKELDDQADKDKKSDKSSTDSSDAKDSTSQTEKSE